MANAFAQGSALPFKTQDAILANCLVAAGFKETNQSPVVIYDADILFRAGGGVKDPRTGVLVRKSRYAGLNLVEAARRASKEGQRGRVEYHFEHHPELRKFCDIYSDECRQIEASDEDASGRMLDIAGCASSADTRETVLRLLCIALKLRVEFVNRWKIQTPYVLVRSDSTPQSWSTGNQQFQVHPGGKMVSINADDKTLKNLGLI